MKVLFANPPVVRSADSRPENGFKLEWPVFRPWLRGIPGGVRAFQLARSLGFGRSVRYGVRAGSRWPWTLDAPPGSPHFPFIMAYAAAYLERSGLEVGLIDSVAEEEFSYERFLRRVRSEAADIVVVECSTPTIDIDTWLASRIASFSEVALAGPHLTTTAPDLQARFPMVRYLLKGEYIRSALDMARSRRPGIYESDVVPDLDAIPFPFRRFRGATGYFDPSMPTARPQLQVWGSKGCPFHCTYCLWPQTMYARGVALRRADRIGAEIRECVAEQGYRSIFFDDDTFNIGTPRVAAICDELRDIGLPWTMMGRLDSSPEWLFDKMVDSGCVGMRFGIETFDLEVLKRVEKGIERTDFRATLERIARRHPGLMIHLTMMKDLPGQTEAIHQLDLRILEELGFTPDDSRRSYQLAVCAPFPGTKLHDQLVAVHGTKALEDWRRYDGAKATVMTELGESRTPGATKG